MTLLLWSTNAPRSADAAHPTPPGLSGIGWTFWQVQMVARTLSYCSSTTERIALLNSAVAFWQSPVTGESTGSSVSFQGLDSGEADTAPLSLLIRASTTYELPHFWHRVCDVAGDMTLFLKPIHAGGREGMTAGKKARPLHSIAKSRQTHWKVLSIVVLKQRGSIWEP